MPRIIDRDGVLQLMHSRAQVVDVLPPREFAESHLPGAINIPLKRLDGQAVAQLEFGRPIIVYCHDLQ